MAKLPSIEEMAKDVAQRAIQEITINDMTLSEFIEKVNNAVENQECHVASCRYNDINCKCTNDEKRKECVRVSKAVLLLDDLVETKVPDNQWAKKRKPFNVCKTNHRCPNDPCMCSYAVECSTLEDVGNGIHKYMCGRDKCKYCK